MILTLIKSKWFAAALIVAFYLGSLLVAYNKGVHSERLTQLVSKQSQQLNTLNGIIETERKNIELAKQHSQKLDDALKQEELRNGIIERNLKAAKDRIDRDNVIRVSLLRIISETNSTSVSAYSATTSESESQDRIIPASDYAHWAAGLANHDNKCVIQLNTVIDYYNELREKFNK